MFNRTVVAAAIALLGLSGCAEDPVAVSAGPGGASPTGAAKEEAPATAPAAARPEPTRRPEPAARPEPARTAPTDPGVAEFLGYAAPKPAVWLWHPPETRMRAANYVVPAESGGDQAHVVVFGGIGGTREANIDRWRGQFRDVDHTPVEAHISHLEADGLPITLVELQGERMRMGDGWYTPNQLLLAAIVHDPRGDIHIMFQGQYETVHANREAFTTFLEGLERTGDG